MTLMSCFEIWVVCKTCFKWIGFTGLEIIALLICEIPIDLPLTTMACSSPINTHGSIKLPNFGVKWCVAPESIYQGVSQLLKGIVGDVEVVSIVAMGFGSWALDWEFGNCG